MTAPGTGMFGMFGGRPPERVVHWAKGKLGHVVEMGVDHRMGKLVINKSWRVSDLALLGGPTCCRRRRHRRRRIFQSEGVDRSWGVKDTIVFLLSFSGRCSCILG